MNGSHSLNDAHRFQIALAGSPDVVDDPHGLDSPLAQWAARLGIGPGEFCEICRQFQKLRADHMAQRGEDGGIGGSLDLQGLNSGSQHGNLIHRQHDPISDNTVLATLNSQQGGVQSARKEQDL